jgi:hypothetical protein
VIIIERPEELAEKVLPLVYRQSRFASFSRQLNVSLRDDDLRPRIREASLTIDLWLDAKSIVEAYRDWHSRSGC